jgi:hypothetical protein
LLPILILRAQPSNNTDPHGAAAESYDQGDSPSPARRARFT